MEPQPRSYQELTNSLEETRGSDYRFLVTDKGQVFISLEPTTAKNLSHEEWMNQLRSQGFISEDETVKGGYLVRVGNRLLYMGESRTIPGATSDDLLPVLKEKGAIIVSSLRTNLGVEENSPTDGLQ
jgi:hypothetical protein